MSSKLICAPVACGNKGENEVLCHLSTPCVSTKACAEEKTEVKQKAE